MLRGSQLAGARVVLDILILNTLTDLDNLIKENIPELKWLKKKMISIGASSIERTYHFHEVAEFVRKKIARNRRLEMNLRGRNNPGKEWLTNIQAIRRVLHEQRFSEQLGQVCVDHLTGSST